MEASFYPPRHQFNNNSYDDNLKLQHEELKRIMNKYDISPICSTNEQQEPTIFEKIKDVFLTANAPKPIKFKRRTKKELQS
jgi:hypothetical protein